MGEQVGPMSGQPAPPDRPGTHNGESVGPWEWLATRWVARPFGRLPAVTPTPGTAWYRLNSYGHLVREPCTCGGCWACEGHVVGCTCDIAWDCEHGRDDR